MWELQQCESVVRGYVSSFPLPQPWVAGDAGVVHAERSNRSEKKRPSRRECRHPGCWYRKCACPIIKLARVYLVHSYNATVTYNRCLCLAQTDPGNTFPVTGGLRASDATMSRANLRLRLQSQHIGKACLDVSTLGPDGTTRCTPLNTRPARDTRKSCTIQAKALRAGLEAPKGTTSWRGPRVRQTTRPPEPRVRVHLLNVSRVSSPAARHLKQSEACRRKSGDGARDCRPRHVSGSGEYY